MCQPPPSTEVNLLEEEQGVLIKKPSQMEAMANKAMLALAHLPKEHKTKIILGILLIVFSLFFAVINYIYWGVVIINKYNAIGWILLIGVLSYTAYVFYKSVYLFFKNKKYGPPFLTIHEIWCRAKHAAELKLS